MSAACSLMLSGVAARHRDIGPRSICEVRHQPCPLNLVGQQGTGTCRGSAGHRCIVHRNRIPSLPGPSSRTSVRQPPRPLPNYRQVVKVCMAPCT